MPAVAPPRPARRRRTWPDQRLHPRIHFRTRVTLRSADNFFAGRTHNISLGGIFVETEALVPVGSIVGVSLTLDAHVHELETEVMWTMADELGRPRGLGLQFMSLPTSLKRRIETFAKQREPDPFDLSCSPTPVAVPRPEPAPSGTKGPPPLPSNER